MLSASRLLPSAVLPSGERRSGAATLSALVGVAVRTMPDDLLRSLPLEIRKPV